MPDDIAAGVVGVGSMGRHHARVYHELDGVTLAGVADADAATAESVAREYGTVAMDADALFERVDAVSIAVPTRYHLPMATAAIDEGTAVLVEKPIAADVEEARTIIDRAEEADVPLQVGHIERFNPAIRALEDVLSDETVIAVSARRLGPPVDRELTTSAVMDLMIHDIDVCRWLVDAPVVDVGATGASEGWYCTANVEFANGIVGNLTASRVTQQKIRDLSITAENSRIHVDYADQNVSIHRHSVPEYIAKNGDVRYRHESIIEQPTVDNGEPLKAELRSFVAAAAGEADPVVTGEDGLQALTVARRIEELAERRTATEQEVPSR